MVHLDSPQSSLVVPLADRNSIELKSNPHSFDIRSRKAVCFIFYNPICPATFL